jgi:hypothetical protein
VYTHLNAGKTFSDEISTYRKEGAQCAKKKAQSFAAMIMMFGCI